MARYRMPGFGLGFERLVSYITGMANIRDVIPYPRVPEEQIFDGHKKRPGTSSVLFLAVLRTSRHPQSASMLHKVMQFLLLWSRRSVPFPTL